MIIKFIYPQSNDGVAIIRSKRAGFIKRRWQRDMPIQLHPHCTQEEYDKAIRTLDRVSVYTLWGQLATLIPVFLCGAVMFGVGQANKSSDYTPIYWYIGILLLSITFICFLGVMITIKTKYIKNLAYTVAGIHTRFHNQFGVAWTLKYVDFSNKKGKRRPKIWCEVSVPLSPLAQQPIMAHPSPYPNQQYIPMTHFHQQGSGNAPSPTPTYYHQAPQGYSQYPGPGPMPGATGEYPGMHQIPIDSKQPVNLAKHSDQ
ncbi:hypothetical protein SAMD00019534_012380, partial [Acytostelium subglobosum LB1]|uniref:hypothetical protein n=1 Tax=Acytostelium subglobosum LB1 TaxID=1410327 RepID=UPI000644DDD3